MELSKQRQQEARKLDVTVQYMVMADLCVLGYSEADAYTVAFPENAALAVQQNQSIRRNITESAKFKRLVEARRERFHENAKSSVPAGEIELIGAEETAREILKVAQKMEQGSKERGEMFMKYADLIRKNEQGSEDVTEAISFGLPLKCNQCPLLYSYNEQMRKDGGQEIRPVEMERVIRLARRTIHDATESR